MPIKPFQSRDRVERVRPYLDKLGACAAKPDDAQAAAGQFWGELMTACNTLPPEGGEQPSIDPRIATNADQASFDQFAIDELVNMTGRWDIHSLVEAFLKANALLKKLTEGKTCTQQRFLYRGQRNIGWTLLPRKGRALLKAGWTPPDEYLDDKKLTVTLTEELESVAEFRESWPSLVSVEDEDRAKTVCPDSVEWWFRMQHYDDDGDGTRLLDVTQSLQFALLFACMDWELGTVDDNKTDGVVYFWPEGENSNVDDFLIQPIPESIEKLFSSHPNGTRFILNPPHNERSKAQAGSFIWWPRFWEQNIDCRPYYLRVDADAKEDIVRELLSMGCGPKEAVRGRKGLENECSLRHQLGLPKWEPLQLKSLPASTNAR